SEHGPRLPGTGATKSGRRRPGPPGGDLRPRDAPGPDGLRAIRTCASGAYVRPAGGLRNTMRTWCDELSSVATISHGAKCSIAYSTDMELSPQTGAVGCGRCAKPSPRCAATSS